MKNRVFNTVFENMLRVLLLVDTMKKATNVERIAAIDFICIYGEKFKILDKNLHGDNVFGFSEFANKRVKISEAVKLAVRNNFLDIKYTQRGFEYKINSRGKKVVKMLESPYAKSYRAGARIICRKFSGYSDQKLLQYISGTASEQPAK